MIGLLFGVALACDALTTLPDRLQVAWISPLTKSVGASAGIYVVRAAELRSLVTAAGRDEGRVLQSLGLLAKDHEPKERYKVVIFDVRSDRLCRPIPAEEGTTEAGLAVCPSHWQARPPGVKRSAWPGCGYLLSTATGTRSLDVFAISWEQASSLGFCVLPLERFLDEA